MAYEINSKQAVEELKRVYDRLLTAPVYTEPTKAYARIMESFTMPAEEKPATLEQWRKLYEVSASIRYFAPWRLIHESECFTLLFPDMDEPVFIVVMGNGGLTYGIGVYAGYEALNRLKRMISGKADVHDPNIAISQHCINLYFGDREELEKRDRTVIKELGLKFRGRNEWPYFRSMIPGYLPWFLNYDEAELAIQALQHAFMAFLAYEKYDLGTDLEDDWTFARFYVPKDDLWCCLPAPLPSIPQLKLRLTISDDTLLAELKQSKKNSVSLGVIATYLPFPIQETKNARPHFPAIIVLLDNSSGFLLDQRIGEGPDFFDANIINMLIEYMLTHGKPKRFVVCDDNAECRIRSFAELVSATLETDMKLARVRDNLISIMTDSPE